MTIVEEPFLHSRLLAEIFRPGFDQPGSVVAALRRHEYLSRGFEIQTPGLRQYGIARIRLFSALNRHAARLARLGHNEQAREVGRRAAELEASEVVIAVRNLVVEAAELVAEWAEQSGVTGPIELQKFHRSFYRWYLELSSSLPGPSDIAHPRPPVPRSTLVDWLSRPSSWTTVNQSAAHRVILLASRELAEASEQVVPPDSLVLSVSGWVRRVDKRWAHVVGSDGAIVSIPRQQLDERGLGHVGQPVVVTVERLHDGVQISLITSAVSVGSTTRRNSGFLPPDGPLEFKGADSHWVRKSFEHLSALEPITVLLTEPEP